MFSISPKGRVSRFFRVERPEMSAPPRNRLDEVLTPHYYLMRSTPGWGFFFLTCGL